MSSLAPIPEVEHILITEELARRPSRRPRVAEENRAMGELIGAMAGNAGTVLMTVADSALRLCRAGSTGISLLEDDATEGTIFRWVAMAGALAGCAGGHSPRHFSACGVCLGYRTPVLLSYPGRVFPSLREVAPTIVEGLIVPISYAGDDLGTLWIVSHDEKRKFDREDVRIMSNLANATAVVLHLKRRTARQD